MPLPAVAASLNRPALRSCVRSPGKYVNVRKICRISKSFDPNPARNPVPPPCHFPAFRRILRNIYFFRPCNRHPTGPQLREKIPHRNFAFVEKRTSPLKIRQTGDFPRHILRIVRIFYYLCGRTCDRDAAGWQMCESRDSLNNETAHFVWELKKGSGSKGGTSTVCSYPLDLESPYRLLTAGVPALSGPVEASAG